MLKDIVKKIDSAIPSLFPVDPSQFNDPVALQTEWKGIRFGRVSRASNKLVQSSPEQLTYKPSLAGRVIGALLILAGIFVIYLYFTFSTQGSNPNVTVSGDPILFAIVGLAFLVVGVIVTLQASSPVVFDKGEGLFYKGRRQRRQPDATNTKHAVSFSDIHAIQLLTRLESSKNNNSNLPPRFYRVYDLNLVKHDGQRLYVTTYGQADKARGDAAQIGAFIQVPVWDGIDG